MNKHTSHIAHHACNSSLLTFLTCCVLLWIAEGYLLLSYPTDYLHLALQPQHTPFSDTFFRYYSSFAEWLLYLFMLLPLAFKQWRLTISYAITEGISALIVQIIKHSWNMPRPVTWFTEQYGNADMLQLVEGVRINAWHSFPSGHTATFFAFFTITVFLLCPTQHAKHKNLFEIIWGLSCFILALTGGYSRIYLSQHFLLDVFVGSVIGTLSALFTLFLIRNISTKKLQNKPISTQDKEG